jgi:hypothetical protein
VLLLYTLFLSFDTINIPSPEHFLARLNHSPITSCPHTAQAQETLQAHHQEEGKEKVEQPLQHRLEEEKETEARPQPPAWGKAVHLYHRAEGRETASHQRD